MFIFLVPLPVTDVTAARNGVTSATVSWQAGMGSVQDAYRVSYVGTADPSRAETITTTSTNQMFNQLFPGELDTYTVVARSADRNSTEASTQLVQSITQLHPPLTSCLIYCNYVFFSG